MSIFSELMLKITEISDNYVNNFNDDLKVAFESIDKVEDLLNGRNGGREKAQKDKIVTKNLQSINEDEVVAPKDAEEKRISGSNSNNGSSGRGSLESDERRAPKKRSKNEVDDMSSPEVDKRQKRNASVKAQSIITKQVNTNLTAKLRRENSTDQVEKIQNQSSRSRRRKDDEKENDEPNVIDVQIKEEKISLPAEPMDMDALPINVEVKQESNKDEIAMPPPAMPVPKPRKGVAKEKTEGSADEETGKRRTRTKKQDVAMPPPPPPVAATRSTRASNRTRQTVSEEVPVPTETRPKRTRAKKKSVQSVSSTEMNSTQPSQECVSATGSPAEKPRPKRTRRGKAAEKQEPPKPVETISPKEERISQPEISSPIIQQKEMKVKKNNKIDIISTTIESSINSVLELEETRVIAMDKTTVIGKDMDKTTVIGQDCVDKASKDMDKTVVLPNGVSKHAPINRNMNDTVVIEKSNRGTFIMEKPQPTMDATVVIDKGPKATNLTDDNSLLTDDESLEEQTPPKKGIPETQPSSAVKEKVQQFEEMASRVTRTKTRAMAKKEEQVENQTPPDKISKPILSAETLTKMNSLIFNGKATQISQSASKPRALLPTKSLIPSSTSKLSSIGKHKEAAELATSTSTSKLSALSKHKEAADEDARKKKEAMLEAKREMHKRKREEKMAAAAAARNAAERDRKAALEAAAKERMEKQASADAGKLERMKEAERKKQDLARKVAETEERRKAEETARMQRLAEEQKRAMEQRRKQIEEQEAMKKEAAIMQREIEKRQKEYNEKQKKQRLEDKLHTPLKSAGTPGGYACAQEPVYMLDGFQYLNSDEDEEPPPRPVPEWSTSKSRKLQLDIQSHITSLHIDRLFSVRVHSPDLRDIFPNIERNRLKRTSSAVWRTPPAQLRTVLE